MLLLLSIHVPHTLLQLWVCRVGVGHAYHDYTPAARGQFGAARPRGLGPQHDVRNLVKS